LAANENITIVPADSKEKSWYAKTKVNIKRLCKEAFLAKKWVLTGVVREVK